MIRLQREKFLHVLESVVPGLSRSIGLQQSNCFAFSKGKVMTFNEEVACWATSGLDESFSGAVMAKKLLEVLPKLPDDELQLTTEDDDKGRPLFVLKGKGRKSRFGMESQLTLPIGIVDQPQEW